MEIIPLDKQKDTVLAVANYKLLKDDYQKIIRQLTKGNIIDRELYKRCVDLSEGLTKFLDELHPLKALKYRDMIRDVYYIRADLIIRNVGINTNTGPTETERGTFIGCIHLLRRTLSIEPLHQEAMGLIKVCFIYITIGNTDFDDCITILKQALFVYPDDYQIQYNLGLAYHRLNKLEDAISSYKLSFGILKLNDDKDSVVTMFKIKNLNSIGSIYYSIQQRELALYFFKIALEISPDDPDINNQLGVVYTELRLTDLALKHYKHAIKCYKNSHISGDSNTLLASLHMNMGLAKCYECDYDGSLEAYNKALEYKPRLSLAYQNKLLDLNYVSHLIEDPDYIPNAHKNINNIYEKVITDYHESIPDYIVKKSVIESINIDDLEATNSMSKEKTKITIGFVSGDFLNHPVSYFISGVLKGINFDLFNIICYSSKMISAEDKFPQCKWVTVKGISANDFAERIKKDKVDILIDLSGHTGDNKLSTFVLKPAPIQISYCGYPGTSGIASMDYHLTDKIANNKKSEHHYTEKLVYLDNCFLNYTPDTTELPKLYPTNNDYITFGSFNRFNKTNESVMDEWKKILVELPNARLLVKTKEFLTERIKMKFLDYMGDDLVPRITVLEYSDTYADHLQDYNLVDVALDTFPYSGTTTSCEALYMGVPVLTIFDNVNYKHSQNVTSSLLSHSDLRDFITFSKEEYVSKAIELSGKYTKSNEEYKSNIRNKFTNGDVFNTIKFIKSFEKTMYTLYKNHF